MSQSFYALPNSIGPIRTSVGACYLQSINTQYLYPLVNAASRALNSVLPRMYADACPATIQSAKRTCQYMQAQRTIGKGVYYLLMHQEQCLGMICITHVPELSHVYNLGYWVVPHCANQGLGFIMCREFCRSIQLFTPVAQLSLLIEPDNIASNRIADKLGARVLGVSPVSVYHRLTLQYVLNLPSLTP